MSKGRKQHKTRQRALLELSISDDETFHKKAKNQPKRTLAKDEESEEDVEHLSSSRTWGHEELNTNDLEEGLPILSSSGKWKMTQKVAVKKTKESEDQILEDTEDLAPKPTDVPRKSVEEARQELASLAISITEDAEGNISKFKEMLTYLDIKNQGIDVVRLSLLSTLAVIKDVLPGYYIRPLNEAEKNANVSKDIKKMRTFDETFLSGYRKFLEILKNVIHPKNKNYPKRTIPILQIALTCIFELMVFAGHFNYFEEILKLAAFSLTLPFEGEAERAALAFGRLFENDEQGQSTFLAVRLISNMIKDMDYDCPVIWLKALQSVRIRSELSLKSSARKEVVHKKKSQHLSGRQKKEWKAKQEELKKMAEAEETVSFEDMNKWNRETLKYLFRVYFGVLKHAPRPDLLPEILLGLSRHSHRIGVEYFTDLLQSLRKLLTNQDQLELVPSLHCILTVDRIYSINENLSSMDLKFFYNSLFCQLGRLSKHPTKYQWDDVQIPLKNCLSNLFHPKRQLPTVRVAGFLQRLSDVASSLLRSNFYGPAVFIVDYILMILTHHNRAQNILDREPFGQGAYLPDCNDPDLCNPYSRSLYDVLIRIKSQDTPQGKLRSIIDKIIKLAP